MLVTDTEVQVTQLILLILGRKRVITFTGDTSGVINNDNGRWYAFIQWLGAGSNFTSGTLQQDKLDQTTRAVGTSLNLADSTDNEHGILLEYKWK